MKKSSYFPNNEESNINDEPSILHITAGLSEQYIEFPEARNILWNRARMGSSVLLKSNDIVPPLLLTHSVIKQLIDFFNDNNSNNVFESTIELANVDSLTQSDLSYRVIGLPKYVFQIKQSDLYNAHSSELCLKVPIYVHDPSDMVLEFEQEITSNLIGNFSKSLSLGREFSFKSCFRLRAAATIRQNSSNPVLTMRFEAIIPDQWFQLTPINSIGIFTSPLSIYVMGYIFGNPKSASVAPNPALKQKNAAHKPLVGYLTLNQTRKVVLLLETDPAASTSPLVGLWIKIPPIPPASINKTPSKSSSYQSNSITNHPLIWALCIRYLRYIITGIKIGTVKEAVFVDPALMTFLLVVFTPDGKINFFEVTPFSESSSKNIKSEKGNFVNDGFMCMDFTVDLVTPDSDDEASNPPLICKFHPLSRPESIFSFAESVRFAGVVGIGRHDNSSSLYKTATAAPTRWLPPSPPQDDNQKFSLTAATTEEGEREGEGEDHMELPEQPLAPSVQEEEVDHGQLTMPQNPRQYSYQRIKETLEEGGGHVPLPVDPFSGGYPTSPPTSLLPAPSTPQSTDVCTRYEGETTPVPRVDVPVPLQTPPLPAPSWRSSDRVSDRNDEGGRSYNQIQADKYTPCDNCRNMPALLNEVYQLRQTVQDLIALIHHYGIPLPPPPSTPPPVLAASSSTSSDGNHLTPPPSHYYRSQSHSGGSPAMESYSNSEMNQPDWNQNAQFPVSETNTMSLINTDPNQLPTTSTSNTTTSALNFFDTPPPAAAPAATETVSIDYSPSKDEDAVAVGYNYSDTTATTTNIENNYTYNSNSNYSSPPHNEQMNRTRSSGSGSGTYHGSHDRSPGSAVTSPQIDGNRNRVIVSAAAAAEEVLNSSQLNDQADASSPSPSRAISTAEGRLSNLQQQSPDESTPYGGYGSQGGVGGGSGSNSRRTEQSDNIRNGSGFVEEEISSMETLDSSLFRPMVVPVIPEAYFPLPFMNLRTATFNVDHNHWIHTQLQLPPPPPPPVASTVSPPVAASAVGHRDWDRRMDSSSHTTTTTAAAAYANYVFDNNPSTPASTSTPMPVHSPNREVLSPQPSPPSLKTTPPPRPLMANNDRDSREESESILAIQARYLASE